MRRFGWMVWLLLLLPALVLAQAGEKESSEEEKDPPKMSAGTFSSFELRGIGPALMSGRVSDIAIDPRDQSTWYVGVGSGGVWKTTNAGTTWTPIFDAQSVYSIGEITLDPQRPDTVWVGSGENVGGRHVSFGDGIYRSRDGGQSWENLGLENSEHIGSIVVHPEDSNVVWVAAQGPLWSPGGDRGVFKTTDGGETWNKVLGGETPDEESYTGANEVVIDPANPDVLYAALHHKFRDVAALINAGPESAIYKSVDGGENWRKLSNGLPGEDMGKIGLAVSPHNSDVVYATIELAAREGGFYRSTDAGESWEKRNDYISGGTGPHYYQEIFADPHRFDRVYQMDARMRVTNDGGLNFEVLEGDFKHVDNHALGFDPDDPDYLLVGCDGGLYETFDNGDTWKYVANLPVTQFYKVAVDVDAPFYNVYGGTQDNSTQGGPSRTSNIHGIRNSDWFLTLFGDGHQPATDPENPDIVYSEWQQGNMVRYDRKTGEIVYIQPQPGPGEPAERWNWDSPIIVSPHDPARIYFASQRLWRSDDRGDSWRPVSGDLSRGEDRLTRPMMGRVWSIDAAWDLWAMSYYGNITSISESPVVEGLLYAGTDDGLVQVSEDGGENWRQAGALPDVPEYAFVNDIKADLHDADTVYVALDHHKSGDYRPFLLKSADRGVTWTSIAGDPEDGGIPDKHLVWRLVQDHEKPELLFVGTEFGVFFSVEGGNSWIELNGGVPTIAWRDLAIQKRENDLVGATFGRGFYIFDDYTPLREVSEQRLTDEEGILFPIRDAWWYHPERTLGGGMKASQGDAFFVAPNPPFGAVFTYYLRDSLETKREQRQSAERDAKKEGEDTPYPGWDALREEEVEDPPAIVLTVRDASGMLVRRVEGQARAGFHRVAWDLRYPGTQPWSPNRGGGFFGGGGVLAPPGTYRAQLAKRVDGALTPLGDEQTFVVKPLRETVLPGMGPAEAVALHRRIAEIQRAVWGTGAALEEAMERVEAIKDVLHRSTVDDMSMRDEAVRIGERLWFLNEQLNGDSLKGNLGEPVEPTIGRWLFVASFGSALSTYGPTAHHQQNLAWAEEAFAEVRTELKQLIEKDLEALEARLEAADVPWTPGRGIPTP